MKKKKNLFHSCFLYIIIVFVIGIFLIPFNYISVLIVSTLGEFESKNIIPQWIFLIFIILGLIFVLLYSLRKTLINYRASKSKNNSFGVMSFLLSLRWSQIFIFVLFLIFLIFWLLAQPR